MPKYPQIHIRLVGQDGNAFAILGRVADAMRRAGIDKKEISEYREAAMSGDYNNLLRVTMETVTCDDEEHIDEYDD